MRSSILIAPVLAIILIISAVHHSYAIRTTATADPAISAVLVVHVYVTDHDRVIDAPVLRMARTDRVDVESSDGVVRTSIIAISRNSHLTVLTAVRQDQSEVARSTFRAIIP